MPPWSPWDTHIMREISTRKLSKKEDSGYLDLLRGIHWSGPVCSCAWKRPHNRILLSLLLLYIQVIYPSNNHSNNNKIIWLLQLCWGREALHRGPKAIRDLVGSTTTGWAGRRDKELSFPRRDLLHTSIVSFKAFFALPGAGTGHGPGALCAPGCESARSWGEAETAIQAELPMH